MRVVGGIVAFAFLVGPALLLSRRFAVVVLAAAAIGALSGAAGLLFSFRTDLPTGPTIAALAVAPLLPAAVGAALRR